MIAAIKVMMLIFITIELRSIQSIAQFRCSKRWCRELKRTRQMMAIFRFLFLVYSIVFFFFLIIRLQWWCWWWILLYFCFSRKILSSIYECVFVILTKNEASKTIFSGLLFSSVWYCRIESDAFVLGFYRFSYITILFGLFYSLLFVFVLVCDHYSKRRWCWRGKQRGIT